MKVSFSSTDLSLVMEHSDTEAMLTTIENDNGLWTITNTYDYEV